MPRVPLIFLQPQTCLMLADHHAKESPETEAMWLRVALILQTVMLYNDGTWDEETMHDMFDMAFSDNDENVRVRTRELIR